MSELHLVERFATGGLWRAVQQWPSSAPLLSGPRQRTSYWHEPPGVFRDRLGQFCWRTPNGTIFCSDTAKSGRHGIVEGGEQAMRWLGFIPAFGAPIESGATE